MDFKNQIYQKRIIFDPLGSLSINNTTSQKYPLPHLKGSSISTFNKQR